MRARMERTEYLIARLDSGKTEIGRGEGGRGKGGMTHFGRDTRQR